MYCRQCGHFDSRRKLGRKTLPCELCSSDEARVGSDQMIRQLRGDLNRLSQKVYEMELSNIRSGR